MSVEPHLPPRTRKDDRIQWKVLGSANTTRYWRAAPRSDGHNLSSFRSKHQGDENFDHYCYGVFFGGGRKKCLKWQKLDLRKRKENIMIWWNLGSGKVYFFSSHSAVEREVRKICLLVSRAGKLTNRHQGSSQTAIGQVGWLDEVNQWGSPTTLPKKRLGASQWNSCGAVLSRVVDLASCHFFSILCCGYPWKIQ